VNGIAVFSRQAHLNIGKVPIFTVTMRFMHNSTQLINSKRGSDATMSSRDEEKKELALRERKVFSRNFKAARGHADLTQDDIVKKTGLSQPFISRVENNRTTINLDNASLLADAVNQPLWKLLRPVDK
jgi:DNA-binding XRE family transcriptional regulator